MSTSYQRDYLRISKALDFLSSHYDQQPKLDDAARHLHLSQHHFHRLFTEFAGVTPKQFLQVITTQHAKKILKQQGTLGTSLASGLSSSSRLYDHFVKIEAVTPGEFKTQGKNIDFYFGSATTRFGNIFVCWTAKGLNKLFFMETSTHYAELLDLSRQEWPCARFIEDLKGAAEYASMIFENPDAKQKPLRAWIRGTAFQLKVWQALLSIPPGQLSTYANLAAAIGNPKASRAVGSAIGKNPVAYLIPCHRVIQQSGVFGGYRWNTTRKTVLLGTELAGIVKEDLEVQDEEIEAPAALNGKV